MKTPLHVLIVEDSEDDARLLVHELTRGGYDVTAERVETAADMKKVLSRGGCELVLSDYSLPHFNGVAAMLIAKERALDIPFIFVSGTIGEDTAIGAMKAGAHDYVIKGNLTRLVPAVARELQEASRRCEARQAVKALHARDEEFRALAEHAPDAICRFDCDCRLTYANPAYEQLLGLPVAQLLARTIQEIYPGQPGIDDYQRRVQQVIATAATFEFETVLEAFSSQHHPCLNIRLVPERDHDGRVVSVLCIGRDISALKTTERQLRTLVENSPDIIMRFDRELRYLFVNRGIEKITGIPAADYLGRALGEPSAVHGQAALAEQMRTLGPGFDQVFTARTAVETEIRLTMPAGDLVFNLRLVPEEDETGQVSSVLVVAREITARKQAEETAQHLACFPELNPNPVLEFSADGTLVYHNPAALIMAQKAGSPKLDDLLPPQTRLIVVECLATNQPHLRLETHHGKYTLSWSFYPIAALQIVHCYVGDISQRLLLEEEYRQAQKMEAIGQLSGGVAHDFNNLLTVIMGNLGLIQSSNQVGPEIAESVQAISHAATRAANLTRQLLAFSRRQVMQAQNLDLNEVVGHITKMLRRVIGEEVKLKLDFAPQILPIHADPGMLEQTILNLSINARDAMPKGGSLILQTAAINLTKEEADQIPSARAGAFAVLTVTDTGTGIAPENIEHVFEPFFTTKEVGKGTGLGLASVYGIAHQHLGWVTVASEVGRGSTFNVYVPLLTTPVVTVSPPALAKEIPHGTETILLVEDDQAVRIMTNIVLTRLGYRVMVASNGHEALNLWESHKNEIQLVLTDMIMPEGVSGEDIARDFKKESPEIKIIFMSGYNADIAGSDFSKEPGWLFLGKPFEMHVLAKMIRESLDTMHPA